MTTTTQLPDSDQLRGPWWTYDEAGSNQPPAEPPPPPTSHRSSDGSARRRTVALALAAALVGGGAGAVVVQAMQPNTPTALAASTIATNNAALGSGASGTATGTPEAAAAVIGPSVVTVEVTGTQVSSGSGRFGGGQAQPVSDTGSGIVLRADGYLLTNNHVVAAAAGGGTVNVTFSNGKTMPATIVGTDATSDLAVLKVTGATGLTPAVFTDSDALKVGQAVLAVGAPLGLSNSVTQGIVSTLHRPVSTGEPGASAQSVLDAVQTDAAINPGNSGGALVDLAGRVVGINSAIATTGSSTSGTSGNIGVGFAIPSNDAKKVADQLIATGHATHAQIGISATDTASATNGAPGLGATVQAVTPGGPAQAAGLAVGDVITRVGARPVTDADSLIVAVRTQDPGTSVAVTYTRGGSQHTVSIRLASATS